MHGCYRLYLCMQFGPSDCNVTLKQKACYLPKSLSFSFRVQLIMLPAFSAELCPVRALNAYLKSSVPFWQSEQLFVCYGDSAIGSPVWKQRLSHWIVDAINLAFSSQGMKCPIYGKAHPTRAIAFSCAWYRGASI